MFTVQPDGTVNNIPRQAKSIKIGARLMIIGSFNVGEDSVYDAVSYVMISCLLLLLDDFNFGRHAS